MHNETEADAGHKPLIWTYLIQGLGVRWMSLKHVELFTHEIVKRLGAHELGRVSFEIPTDHPNQPGCRVLCGNSENEVYIMTYPEHAYARLMTCSMLNPDVESLSEVFEQFFQPKAQTEGYLESPEF